MSLGELDDEVVPPFARGDIAVVVEFLMCVRTLARPTSQVESHSDNNVLQ